MDIRDSVYELLLIIFLLNTHPGLSFFEDVEFYEPSFNRCQLIHNKLKNGRVRYINKGRIAKFLCDRRFELVGKTSSTCLRGQWNNPVPVCVARGCNRMRSLSNGRVTAMYRGAVLVFVCNPGYVLNGSPAIHCEGRQWNTTPPLCIWNSSEIQNTDESTPKDYSLTSQSVLYTTLRNSGETFGSTTNLQAEKLNSTKDPFLISPSSLTPTSTSLKTDAFTANPIPFETQSNTRKTLSTNMTSSTVLKTDISMSSASIKTTRYVSIKSPISTNRTTLASTSSETGVTSTTPKSTSMTLQTTIPATKQTKTQYITQRTSQAPNMKISTLSTTLETATQSVPISVFVDNTTTTDDNVQSFAISSRSAAATSNTELITLPRNILTSIRNTYNLSPRKSSTTAHTATPILKTTKSSLIIHIKENTSSYILTTSRYLPSIASTKQQTLGRLTTRNNLPDAITGIHASTDVSQTRVENLPQTMKFSNSFTKPTKNTLQKNSELNGKIRPSKSTVKGIVAIVIIALILIIASFACYIRKRRSKRQSKLSDVSDLRFLLKSDYIEDSNSASLNGILIE